uniref:Uncharacterized protein n=1 Tax=Vespula pensylvanica TaxID=30213 RepID=A0A834NA87_VESPE|nr:hypothetical protein H0235_015263 [Vespula pensylvanica]
MQVSFALDCIGRSCETDSPAIRELGVVLLRESTGNLHLKELEEFCVGDQFYLYENKILCEYHYKERVYFANMPHPPPNDTLAHIKRQVTHLQPQAPSWWAAFTVACKLPSPLRLMSYSRARILFRRRKTEEDDEEEELEKNEEELG